MYRWAYEYGVPGLKDDFVPQNQPPDAATPRASVTATDRAPITSTRRATTRAVATREPDGRLRRDPRRCVVLAAVRRLTTRPWEAQGTATARSTGAALACGAHRALGLPRGPDLAVRSSSPAYCMRMGHGIIARAHARLASTRRAAVLWINTVLLALGSVAMQWARVATNRDDARGAARGAARRRVRRRVSGGQFYAWRQLQARGTTRPSIRRTLLLPADRRARPAPARRARRLGQDRGADGARRRSSTRCGSASNCAPCTGTTCCWSGWSCSPVVAHLTRGPTHMAVEIATSVVHPPGAPGSARCRHRLRADKQAFPCPGARR